MIKLCDGTTCFFFFAAIPNSTDVIGDKGGFFHENFQVGWYHVLSVSSGGIFFN